MVTIDITFYCNAFSTFDTEILACKIAQHRDQKIVLDLGLEGWSIVENGIEQVVKNIADNLSIPYTQIEFITCDRTCNSNTFKHTINKEHISYFTNLGGLKNRICPTILQDYQIKLPTANNYGLFLERASNERLYSFWKHKNWQYSDRGKATFQFNPNILPEHNSDYAQFVCDHNEKWQSIVPLFPYSDTGQRIVEGRIVPDTGTPESDYEYALALEESDMAEWAWVHPEIWDPIYKDVAIDLVCETSIAKDNFFVTEKALRPISMGRLFMVIGSPEFEQNLKRMGFDIFDDVIDKSYDSEYGIVRVDAVYKSLGKLLSNTLDMNKLLPRLEANKQVLDSI